MALIINGEHIDDEIIEAEFRDIKGWHERTLQVACCERDPEFRASAKENISSRVLLGQEARRAFPDVSDADVDLRLEKLIAEAGGEQEFYFKIGMPVADKAAIRENLASGVRLDKLLQQTYAPEPTPSEADIRAAYEAQKDTLYLTEEEVHAAHITKNLQGATNRKDVYQAMRQIRRQLLDGADFMQLAQEHRLDEQQQIDLGWFKRGEFMEEFETIAFSLEKGEISPVFTTQLGFHICTLLGRKEPQPKPFDEVHDQVANRIIEEHRDAKFHLLVTQLRDAAKIEDTDPPDEPSDHASH
ncbi:MAG: peptidylprolyl isomerase [Verrucomicrobiaceae bacterium]|nr:peptidylprolyl isomerase [Verrucomicrobiaceae bacterium]